MNDDLSTPEERRAQRREARAAKARLAQDDAVIQSIMSSAAGRQWVHDMLAFCAVFQPIANSNPYYTYLNEGKRNVGLRLLADVMRACPEAYIRMMEEQGGGRTDNPVDRRDPDDDRNYDSAGRWIGDGEPPEAD